MLDMKTKTFIISAIIGILALMALCLFSHNCNAQTGVIRFPQWYEGNGDPVGSSLTTFPGLANGAGYKNRLTGDKFYYKNSTVKWVKDNTIGLPTKGDKGDTGPQGPIGPAGPPGSGGGGSGTFINPYLKIDLTRIEVAAYPTTATVSGAGILPSVFAGITVSASDNLNWANLQYAIYLSKTTKKKIYSSGDFIGINKDIVIDRDHYSLNWDGQDSKISTFTTSPITVLNRVDATSTTWAFMISFTKWNIENLNFALQSGQTGMDVQMQNNSTFYNFKFMGGLLAIKANFCIETRFEKINLGEIAQGISLDNAEYTGGGTVGTGSVKNTFRDIHYANAQGNGQYAIKLRACESTYIENIIVEGAHQIKGIWADGCNDPNFRILTIKNVYGEDCHSSGAGGPCTTIGQGEALIYVRNWSSGIIDIDAYKHIYKRILSDVSTSGYLTVKITNLVFAEKMSEKLFYTDPGALALRYVLISPAHDGILTQQTPPLPTLPITNQFAGKSISEWWKTGVNQYQPINTVVVY